jgi:hypothetical protein
MSLGKAIGFGIGGGILILLCVALIVLGPLLLIWGVNLMGVAVVPVTLKTWLGALLVMFALGWGRAGSSK